LPVLKKLASSALLRTIIPGRLYKSKSNHQGALELRLTTGFSDNQLVSPDEDVALLMQNQKVIARRSSQVQEVFLVLENNSVITRKGLGDHLRQILRKVECTIS